MDGEEAGTISIGDGVGDGIAITVVIGSGVAVAEVEEGGASGRIFSSCGGCIGNGWCIVVDIGDCNRDGGVVSVRSI